MTVSMSERPTPSRATTTAIAALLGAWLMGSAIAFAVAPTNFRRVDELLSASDNASFRALVERVGAAETRDLLRYLASELNRVLFAGWNVAQAVLGALALVLAWRAASDLRALRRLVLAATLIVALLLVVFTPWITSVGRSLDFVPRQPAPPQLGRFQLLHVAYTALDLIKVVFVALALYRLVRAGRSSPESARESAAGAARAERSV
jgi:hypothetical protein